MKKTISLSLLTISSLFANAELDEIKEQLRQQQIVMQKLQAKVDALTKESEGKDESLFETKMLQAKSSSSSFSQKEYLPDIALILNMSAIGRDVANNEYANYAIPGFINSGDAEIPFNPDRGFNLNYAELAMSSAVDPYFDAFAIFHFENDSVEIDEAYVKTRALLYGLQIKAGKFKSSFGRINSKHQHAWNFSTQAIIYEALFGTEGIGEAGVQLQYVAPTDTYIMAGIEMLQGVNDQSFGDTQENNLYVSYLKSSVDISDDLSVLGGVSFAHGKNSSANDTDIYGVDLTFNKQLSSYSSIMFQNEYLYRNKDIGVKKDKQAGFYSELIYNYNNNYAMGARYEAITKNDTDLSAYKSSDNLDRYTAMLQYKPFPFSRLRLQYTKDKTKVINAQRRDINEIMLSLNIAIGAHGAHDF